MKRIIPILALLLGGCGAGLVPVSEEQARSYCVGNAFGSDIPDEGMTPGTDIFFNEIFDSGISLLLLLRLQGVSKAQAFTTIIDESTCNAVCFTCWTMMADYTYQIELN